MKHLNRNPHAKVNGARARVDGGSDEGLEAHGVLGQVIEI